MSIASISSSLIQTAGLTFGGAIVGAQYTYDPGVAEEVNLTGIEGALVGALATPVAYSCLKPIIRNAWQCGLSSAVRTAPVHLAKGLGQGALVTMAGLGSAMVCAHVASQAHSGGGQLDVDLSGLPGLMLGVLMGPTLFVTLQETYGTFQSAVAMANVGGALVLCKRLLPF